jgi:Holliday junction DNA helicase RuvA
MYDYIKGEITELSPTEAVVETCGIGYKILISLQTYSRLSPGKEQKIYLYQHLREDASSFFGFFDKEERHVFTHLIGVSGIGPNSARMMLSSMTTNEVVNAIISGDVNKIKSVKGIGLKTAQKVIIELKDKMSKDSVPLSQDVVSGFSAGNSSRKEASSALVLLGFARNNVEKVLDSLLQENPSFTLEELIKHSLKKL